MIRRICFFKIISLAVSIVPAGRAAGSDVPSWLSAADIVVVAEPNDSKPGQINYRVTEIWKATKVIQLPKLGRLYIGQPPRSFLLLISFPRTDGEATDRAIARVVQIPISSMDL